MFHKTTQKSQPNAVKWLAFFKEIVGRRKPLPSRQHRCCPPLPFRWLWRLPSPPRGQILKTNLDPSHTSHRKSEFFLSFPGDFPLSLSLLFYWVPLSFGFYAKYLLNSREWRLTISYIAIRAKVGHSIR